MARTTKPPQFAFDDSLVILPKRQNQLTQTQRGNYEWSWLQADCWTYTPESGFAPIEGYTLNTAQTLEFLVFGSDVPHLAFYFATQQGQDVYNNAIKAWYIAASSFLSSVTAWGNALPEEDNFPTLTVPTPPAYTPYICTSRASVLTRPSALSPVWNVTSDAGQGALVSVNYTNGNGEQTFCEGFPLVIDDLWCGAESPQNVALEQLIVTVGFESATNHGLAHAQETPTTPRYTPVILRKQDYTPAMRAAGNIVDQGADGLFYIVGLWQEIGGPV